MSVSSYPQGTIAAAAQGTVVTVSNATCTNSDAPAPVSAYYKVDADGNVYRDIGAGYQQINSATDWIRPTTAASGTYSVRATQTGSTGIGTRSGTLNTWLALSVDRIWSITRNASGTATWTLTIEISDDGGSTVLDSGTVTLTADVIV